MRIFCDQQLTNAADDDDYDDRYSDDFERHGGYLTPPVREPAYPGQPQGAYPSSHFFPPPPTGDNEPLPAVGAPPQEPYNPYPAYNPADYAPASGGMAHDPYQATRGAYGASDVNLGAPHPNDTFAGDARYGDPAGEAAAARERQEEREEREERRGRQAGNDPGNVSSFTEDDHDGPSVNGERRAGTSLDVARSFPANSEGHCLRMKVLRGTLS